MVDVQTGDRVVEVTRVQGREGAPAQAMPADDNDSQLDLL